jgi:hypothetical protein
MNAVMEQELELIVALMPIEILGRKIEHNGCEVVAKKTIVGAQADSPVR